MTKTDHCLVLQKHQSNIFCRPLTKAQSNIMSSAYHITQQT